MFGLRREPGQIAVRIANFLNSCLKDLEAKGNLGSAPKLYNPKMSAEHVVLFTLCPEDKKYAQDFGPWNIEIFPFVDLKTKGYSPQNLVKILRAPFISYKKIKKARIDVIRGRLPYFASLVGCLAGRMSKTPTIVSLGGNNRLPQERSKTYHYGSKMISYTMEKWTLILCHVILAPNQYTKRYVASIIGKRRAEKKVRVIPWIIDREGSLEDSHENVPERLGLNLTLPFVLVIGFINPYKYSDIMFKVAEALFSGGPQDLQFVFCGDGPLRETGEFLLQRYENARFLGWQPYPVVQALIRKAAVVLVPMSGFVLLEAAAAGRPVVASNIEWHGELVEDGVSGFLVKPVSVDDWVRKIRLVLGNPELGRTMAENLGKKFRSKYDPDILIDEEIELYRSLVQKKRKIKLPSSYPSKKSGILR